MIVLENTPGAFTEVTKDLAEGENVIPFGNFSVWDDAELATHNCYRIEFPATPEGKMRTKYTIARIDGVVQVVPVWANNAAPSVPQSVTDLQFRLALNQSGLRAAADAYIEGASQDVKDWWDRALTFRLDDPILNAAVLGINKTRADLEALMRLAATMPGG